MHNNFPMNVIALSCNLKIISCKSEPSVLHIIFFKASVQVSNNHVCAPFQHSLSIS